MRRFIDVASGVAWRSVHNAFSNPVILLPSIIFPLFFLAAFAGGLSRVADLPNFHYAPGYTAFQYIFVLLQSAAFGGVFTGFAIARDFESGFARRLLIASPRRSGIIAGYVTGALVRWLFTGVVVTVVALAVGMPVDGSPPQLLALAGLAVAMNLAAALWGCGVAMFLRTEQAGALIQMPVFVVIFLAPVYVPINLLTGWVHAAARYNPATIVFEAGRGLFAGTPVKVGLAFALLAGCGVLLSAWARRGLASAERAG